MAGGSGYGTPPVYEKQPPDGGRRYDCASCDGGGECDVVGLLSGARDTSVSAHLVVGRRGHVIQLLPFNVEAWHAGESEHAGRKGLNACSVGIEIDNAGRLHRRGDRFFSWFNREYMPDEVFTTVENGRAAYYHRFTREQTDRVAEICRLLKARYLMHWLVRHSDITRRKSDPGPAFPFEEVRRQAGF